MPHIICELSDNIIEKDLTKILLQIHQILVDNLPTQLESCKSRIIRHQEFLVGDGMKYDAFIHFNIAVLAGRSKDTLDLTANKLMILVQNNFKQSLKKLSVSVSIEIKNLSETYLKI